MAGFQAMGNGQTAFVIFDTGGAPSTFFLRTEFRGGGIVVGTPSNYLYWIENNAQLQSNIVVNGLLTLPIGDHLTGGLAYRDTDGVFYVIRNDDQGASTFQYLDNNTAQIVSLPITLGSGFTGGLTWDPAADLFYAIATDNNNDSTLYRFGRNDSAATALFGVGKGLTYAGLTYPITAQGSAPDVNPVQAPEPASILLMGAGLTVLGLLGRRQ
jgi:hypothetical protein